LLHFVNNVTTSIFYFIKHFKRDLQGKIIKWYHRGNTSQLSSNIVRDLVRDDKGVLWVLTDNGLATFNGKTWKQETFIDNSGSFRIAKDAKGAIWATTYDAVYSYYQGKWEQYPIEKGSKRAIGFDKDNKIWVSVSNKVYTFLITQSAELSLCFFSKFCPVILVFFINFQKNNLKKTIIMIKSM
jgi:Two component regulator propeller